MPRTRTAVHDAVMHPQSRFAHHCASAWLVQSTPVIEQSEKDSVPVRNGSTANSKCLAHAGTSGFALLSDRRGREQCGDAARGQKQKSACFHYCSNVAAGAAFLTEKFQV